MEEYFYIQTAWCQVDIKHIPVDGENLLCLVNPRCMEGPLWGIGGEKGAATTDEGGPTEDRALA